MCPRTSSALLRQVVQDHYDVLVAYARGQLPPDMHHAADDVTHLAIADLLKKPGGYQDCETEDEMLAVLRTAIKHDAIDALRDPARRHRRLRTFRDDQWDDEAGSRLSGFDAWQDGGAEKDTVDLNGIEGRSRPFLAPGRLSYAALAARLEDALIAGLDVRRAIEDEAITTPKRAVFLFVMRAENAFVEISWREAQQYYEQQYPGSGHLIVATVKPMVERVHASLRQHLVDYDFKGVGPRTQEQIDAADVAFLRRWAAYIRAGFRRDLRRCRRFFA